MASRPLPASYITPEEYLQAERQAEDKSEYCNGDVYAMAGATLRHIRIATNLVFELSLALRGGPCQVFDSDARIHIPASRRYTYADVSVVCGDPVVVQTDNLTNPRIIIEVLSKSTERYDRNAKFLSYQSIPSLKEYLLVSQSSRGITHCTRIGPEEWRIETKEGPHDSILLSSIEVELAFDRIYAGVDPLPT